MLNFAGAVLLACLVVGALLLAAREGDRKFAACQHRGGVLVDGRCLATKELP